VEIKNDNSIPLPTPVSDLPIEGTRPNQRERLEEAAKQFEAYMLKMMMTEMRKTSSEDTLFGSKATDSYQSLMDDALAKRAAEAGSFGLAAQLLSEWDQKFGGGQ
jgi:Rod binding domain-containing protein